MCHICQTSRDGSLYFNTECMCANLYRFCTRITCYRIERRKSTIRVVQVKWAIYAFVLFSNNVDGLHRGSSIIQHRAAMAAAAQGGSQGFQYCEFRGCSRTACNEFRDCLAVFRLGAPGVPRVFTFRPSSHYINGSELFNNRENTLSGFPWAERMKARYASRHGTAPVIYGYIR